MDSLVVSGNSVTLRAMDSGSDGFDYPEDAIEKVARANSVRIDSAQILPEVRASPCAFHFKKDRRNDLSYFNNHHSGHVSSNAMKKSHIKHSAFSDIKKNKPADVRPSDRRPPPPLMNTLPKGMPSKEFVMTWLMHGSDPSDKNHFPDIVIPDGRTSVQRRSKKESLRKSTISE